MAHRAGDIVDLVRLTRPANAFVAAAGAYVGALLSGAAWVPERAVIASMIAAFTFAAAGNVRNDLGDIAIDRVAHPERPLARGSIHAAQARQLAVGLYLVSLAAALLVSWWGALLVLLALPLMEAYERWGKARGLPGNLLVALLTGAPFVLGALAGGGHVGPAALAVAALAALATAGREVLKDVEDVEADVGFRRTLPMRIGARRAALVAGAFLLAAALLSPLPFLLETVLGEWYLLGVVAADACFLAAAAMGSRAPGRAQRLVKLGMVAALLALVLGRASFVEMTL
ncbi:MAG TPA: UbiA family prenyltransferase [Candidatus Thermoplasmatota archaeon]|nr:UbiA family prenyltransferase [Candidatus Thermoplasmatota archaeon]